MMRRKLAASLTAVLLSFGVMLAASPSASAATRLGGVSIWSACVNQHGTPSGVVNVTRNVMGWRCAYRGVAGPGVDLTRECRRTYGSSAYSGYTNWNDPYSWSCYR